MVSIKLQIVASFKVAVAIIALSLLHIYNRCAFNL